MLIIYVIIFVLRMVTWVVSDSVINNRTLVIAGYLYGLNTMFLTFRAFGHVMESTRGVGSIQIALFQILSDVATIFWQFIAVILAFSIAITKVYVAEKSYLVKPDSDKNPWWIIVKHLIWSLLGIVDLDPLDSTDKPSVTVVHFLYGAFLIMGVILLINMMIALLSNTYTRVERRVGEPEGVTNDGNKESLDLAVKSLQVNYFASYGYTFPLTDQGKMDQVLQETKNIRPMTNQVAYNTFIAHGRDQCALPTGPKAWKSEGVRIEECLLMYEGAEFCQTCKDHPTASQRNHGARYLVPFSPEVPRFEKQECRSLEVGVARRNYQSHLIRSRGWNNECVGYHIKGDIFDAVTANSIIEIEDAMAERGDLIGCTVLFEMAENGKVPIMFTLNGKQITQASISIEFDQKDLLLFPFVSMGHEGVTVSAKMRPLDYAGVRFRRIRDDMLNNVRANFRKFEDVFIDWNKECLQMSSSFLRQKVPTGLIEKPTLGKKIKEALEGLKEIEELGKKVNIKFGTVLKELSTKSGSNY
ncbi:hypothetical protein OS493_018792 [Desmophyllum pertusum]|uniref:SPRY domain-containing protein n=1 Tax=Desmophyllum pertusum TaxID=174260 RepID=A0A9W9ZE39_9CNID|nr:hypothetical protein OS493_018792 [Desmophyllum pertusum]